MAEEKDNLQVQEADQPRKIIDACQQLQPISQRLFYSLQVDIDSTCKILDWHPPLSLEEGLSKCLVD